MQWRRCPSVGGLHDCGLTCQSGVWNLAGGSFGTTWVAVGNTSGVNYQNTTGHPIQVSVVVNCNVGGGVVGQSNLYVWGAGQSPVMVDDAYGQCGYMDRLPLTAIVPNNNFYTVLTSPTMSVIGWSELR